MNVDLWYILWKRIVCVFLIHVIGSGVMTCYPFGIKPLHESVMYFLNEHLMVNYDGIAVQYTNAPLDHEAIACAVCFIVFFWVQGIRK